MSSTTSLGVYESVAHGPHRQQIFTCSHESEKSPIAAGRYCTTIIALRGCLTLMGRRRVNNQPEMPARSAKPHCNRWARRKSDLSLFCLASLSVLHLILGRSPSARNNDADCNWFTVVPIAQNGRMNERPHIFFSFRVRDWKKSPGTVASSCEDWLTPEQVV